MKALLGSVASKNNGAQYSAEFTWSRLWHWIAWVHAAL